MGTARRSVATGLALVATLLLAGPAAAHALPQSSDPSAGADLATAPIAVTITFGERPDPKLSTIKVLDTGGNVVSSGSTTAVPADPLKLTVALQPLSAGVYTVAWRTVSAVDGHLATGSFGFGVGVAPSPAAAGSTGGQGTTGGDSGTSAGAILGRWLLFLGLLTLLGAAAFGIIVASPSPILYRRLLPLAWLLAAIGSGIVIAVEIADSGASLDEILGSSLGNGILLRGVPLLVAGSGVVVAQRRPGRASLAVVALGACVALLADVLLSHAAAGSNAAVDVAVQALHVVAVGLWLGGLAGLLLTIGRTADERTARTARRFSWLATIGIAIVAVTGLLRAIAEVGTVDALLTSDFGHLVIAKTALLATLALLGAVNHFRNVPAAGRTVGGLRRVGSVELLVGATVLLLTASLVNLAPPVEVAAAAAPSPSASAMPLIVDGSDFGTSVKVRLAVSPGTAGFDTFTAAVTDYDSGAPVAADGVTLRFVFPARSDVGSSRLDLAPTEAGVFAATGSNLSLDGTWQVTALVARGASSVEVPLELTTRASGSSNASPSPSIDVNAVPGLPTIYTVHLSAGRTVQVYLDPGKPGANEVHVTFFDTAGNELPVASVTMALGPAGGVLAPLTPRQLEPGHFVADTTLAAGTYGLSISGPAPNGDQLTTSLDIPVTK
jgi:copper transport protein